ncbi:MAG: hypothetical protein HQK51_16840 [Oligoflexia bacterium]|nr:hypothetical protein [Oligoflexia bacterium]
MPTLLTIFTSCLSKLFGAGVDYYFQAKEPMASIPKTMEERRLEITLPSANDTNEQNNIRYEYTFELVNNSRIAHRNAEYESAVIYMTEAKRVSGYLGTVGELYDESITLFLKDVNKKLDDCKIVTQKILFIKTTIPKEIEKFKLLTEKCTVCSQCSLL